MQELEPKDILTYQEKHDLIIKLIRDNSIITPKRKKICFPFKQVKDYIRYGELDNLLTKLEEDYQIIKNVEIPTFNDVKNNPDNVFYRLDITSKFEEYYKNLNKDELILADKKITNDNIPKSEKEILYKIDYIDNKIILNEVIVLSSQASDSIPNKFFDYIFKNPNKLIYKSEIEKEHDIKITRELSGIIYDLGFKGLLKDYFFENSKSTIKFKNPIYRLEFEKEGKLKLRFDCNIQVEKA